MLIRALMKTAQVTNLTYRVLITTILIIQLVKGINKK
jgi:hypothetical protein